jgi:hypothetical protein
MTTVRRGGLLTEGARTNLLGTSDLRKFIGWDAQGGATITLTQGLTIAPSGAAYGSPVGEATRIQSSGGTSTSKYRATLSNQTGTRAVQVLVKNQGLTTVEVRAAGATPLVTNVITVPPGETRVLSNSQTYSAQAATFNIATAAAGDSLDIVAWGPMWVAGPVAGLFPGIDVSSVPTDQVSYANFPQPAEIAARGGITVYHRFVEQGTRDVNGGRYWQVGAGSSFSANRILGLYVDANARPNVNLGNASATVGASLSTTHAVGSLVEVAVEVRYTAGTNTFAVRITRSVNGATPVSSAFSSELDATGLIASDWTTAPTLSIGQRDGGNNPGFQLNQALKARFGLHDLASMRALV